MRSRKQALEVASRVDARDGRRLARVSDVDALDPRMRQRTAHESGVRGALAGEVVDVMAVPCDQARVFAAVNLGSDPLGDPPLRSLPPWPSPSSPPTASSSLP